MKITRDMIKENALFHCDSEEKANELLKKLYDLDYKWSDRSSYLDDNYWCIYEENTFYNIYNGTYGDIDCYKHDKYYEYDIIEYILDEDCEENSNKKEYGVVENPAHYTDSKYECIEVMEEIFGIEEVKTFCKLNAFKYLWRANKKNGDQDLEKAKWYLCHRSKLLNGEEVDSGISPKDTLKMIKEISNYKNKEMK